MLHLNDTNLTLYGSSTIDNIQVATMSANYTEPNFIYTVNINDLGSYIEHKQEVDADINSFISTALTTASAIINTQPIEPNAEIEIEEEM